MVLIFYKKQTITQYILRIVKYLEIDQNILILAMMNLDKFMVKTNFLIINKYNCFKIFLASLIETNKLYDDYVLPKKLLCMVGFIESKDLLNIEEEFLKNLNYNLFIEENEFLNYKIKLNNLYKLKCNNLINIPTVEEISCKKINVFKPKCGYAAGFNNATYDFTNMEI